MADSTIVYKKARGDKMKGARVFAIVLILSFYSCTSGKRDQKKEGVIDFNEFKVIEKNVNNLLDIGKISKAVKLETRKDSLVGTINHIKIDEASGDILVADFDSRKKILRFSRDGKFIRSYGKPGQGPGEYNGLSGFGIGRRGEIIVLSNLKLIRYSIEGHLLNEIRIDYYAKEIETFGDSVFVSVLAYRKAPKVKNSTLVLDKYFVKKSGIGEYDSRLRKYMFLPARVLGRSNDRLYYIDYFDLALGLYDLNSGKLNRLRIPNNNSDLDATWGKKRLSEKDRTSVRNRLHRFDKIFALKNILVLFESCPEKDINHVWLLNMDKREITVFHISGLLGDFSLERQKDLFISGIPGAFENGIIGVMENVEEFNLFKEKYPLMKDIQYKMEDNPVLVFFEFNQ